MAETVAKVPYIQQMEKAAKWLPHTYYATLQEMLPDKPLTRLKNARSGIVQDEEVLRAVKEIAEKERLRRLDVARQLVEAASESVL